MKFIKSKRGLALLAVLVVAAVAAIGAYAYFTSTGSGSGTGSVGTAADNLSISLTQHNAGDKLYPGGPSIPADVNVSNPSNFAQAVSSVFPDGSSTAAVAAGADATTGISTSDPDCDGAWFHFNGDGSTVESALVTDDGSGAYNLGASGNHTFAGATLSMDDSGTNQDACKNATITVWLSSN